MLTPFYDPNKSYEENFEQGPFGAFADGEVVEQGESSLKFYFIDRKSTRLNSSHSSISFLLFFFFKGPAPPRVLPSSPPRRSSDLNKVLLVPSQTGKLLSKGSPRSSFTL